MHQSPLCHLPLSLIWLLPALFVGGCSGPGTAGSARRLADQGDATAFDRTLVRLGLHAYAADLHSHHYVAFLPGKKNQNPRACGPSFSGRFPEDDGRWCRDQDTETAAPAAGGAPAHQVVDRAVDHGDPLDYFRDACRYARDQGELDILYVSMHTKNNGDDSNGPPDTDTTLKTIQDRHALLASLNAESGGKFLCGMGQEASSIAKGNHLGIYGHMPAAATEVKPVFAPAGSFDQIYPQVKAHADAGEPIVLQFNHPDVYADLWWKSFAGYRSALQGTRLPEPGETAAPAATPPRLNKSFKSSARSWMNDYGIDDFAPLGCRLTHGGDIAGCAASDVSADGPTALTPALLADTYAAMRRSAGDRFRLIEVATGNATTDPHTVFERTHHRGDEARRAGELAASLGDLDRGIYDYIFYLAMGFRLSPTANQDNHHMNWGSANALRTGVLAPSLAEDDVVRALDARRTFASEDKNAKLLLFSEEMSDGGSQGTPEAHVMGEAYATGADTARLRVAYQDPDAEDSEAAIRFFYYRPGDALDFFNPRDPSRPFGEAASVVADGAPNPVAPTPDAPVPAHRRRDVQRLVSFQDGQAVLPVGPATDAPSDVADRDPRIHSGEVGIFDIPLVPGMQYVFVQLTQVRDKDRIWSAPLWITRVAK